MDYGIVYLLTNPVMPDLVKIGMTTQEDIDKMQDPELNFEQFLGEEAIRIEIASLQSATDIFSQRVLSMIGREGGLRR